MILVDSTVNSNIVIVLVVLVVLVLDFTAAVLAFSLAAVPSPLLHTGYSHYSAYRYYYLLLLLLLS